MYLRKLPSGQWQASVKYQGRRRSATGRTRGEASQAAAELLLELGATPRAKHVTVDELLAAWLAGADLSHTFRTDARRVIERAPEEFKARRIETVTPAVIEGLYRQLKREKWSAHRVGRLHTVLSSSWTLARRYQWVTGNPFADVRKPQPPKRSIGVPLPSQVSALIAAADPTFRLYLLVSASLGTRRGETVALQWGDIADGAVIVRRSLAYSPLEGVTATEGKTGKEGHRVVAIDADLAERLRAHRRAQVEMALAAGLPAPVWVFSHDAGVTPWRPDYASREFRTLRRKVKIDEGVRLHDLRHYVATQLLGHGVPLKAVSDRLGHRQLQTTADVYGHYVQAVDQASAEVMAKLRTS